MKNTSLLLEATPEQREEYVIGLDGRYIGIKKPSQQRTDQILEAIRQLGREMSQI